MSTAIELVLKVWWSRLPVGLHTVFLTTPHPLSVALTVTVTAEMTAQYNTYNENKSPLTILVSIRQEKKV